MRNPWRDCLILGLAMASAGCGTQSPVISGLAGPAEAAAPPANPREPALVLTARWDDSQDLLRMEAFDLATGVPAPGWETLILQGGGRDIGGYSFSPRGDRLAVVSGTAPFCSRLAGGSACWPGADRLHVVDLNAHDAQSFDLGPSSYVPALTFSPDGTAIALALHGSDGFGISLRRIEPGTAPRTVRLPFLPSHVEYSTNGNQLFVLGADPGTDPGMTEPGPLQFAVLDAETLAVLWEQTLDLRHGGWCLEGCLDSHEQTLFANWTPAIVRLPGTDRLLIFHAATDDLTTIDAARRVVVTRPMVASQTWLDRLMAFGTVAAEAKGGSEGVYRQAVPSPDGTRVYLVGRAFDAWRDADGLIQMSDTPLGLQVIDPATGTRLTSVETDADHVSLSPDGSWLLLRSWTASGARTEVIAARSLTQGRSVEDWDIQAGRALNGASVLAATSLSAEVSRLAQFDPATLDIGEPWTLPDMAFLLFP
jgi:WD40 repeat protein